MTNWKTVHGSQAARPEEFDTTSSAVTVYQRRNIERITVENADGSVTELWQYEERQMSREEYLTILSNAILNAERTITNLEIAMCELYEANL